MTVCQNGCQQQVDRLLLAYDDLADFLSQFHDLPAECSKVGSFFFMFFHLVCCLHICSVFRLPFRKA